MKTIFNSYLMGGGRIIICLFFLFFVNVLNSQILTVNFDSDNCGGNGCNLTQDLIGDNCMEIENTGIKIQSLGGLNKITNSCHTWYSGGNGFQATEPVSGSASPKMVVQRFASVAAWPSSNFVSLGEQTGIFFNFTNSVLKNNYFYQCNFNMDQIMDYGCSRIDEETMEWFEAPSAPTVNVYVNASSIGSPLFLHNQKALNETILSSSDFVGNFTTQGLSLGTYHSQIFKIDNIINEGNVDQILQLAFFIDGRNAGACDGPGIPPPGGGGNQSPLAPLYAAALIDDIEFDCDRDNITFALNVDRTPLTDPVLCVGPHYSATLSSLCPNVGYGDYPYTLEISQGNVIKKIVAGTDQVTNFTMDNLPTGTYTVKIRYNTSTGKNVKVVFNGLEASDEFYHDADFELVVTTEEFFVDPIYLPYNVTIKSGGKWSVSNTASFRPSKRITVESGGELFVEGDGHLTACDQPWAGVLLKGSGKASFVNGARVSRASTAVRSETTANQAVVILNNATFYDNANQVALYNCSSSLSSFTNSNLIGGGYGVKLDNVTGANPNGIPFDGNTFSYPLNEGILSFNSAVNVFNGNHFVGGKDGIALRDLYGNLQQSRVGSENPGHAANTFSNCNYGVFSNASNQFITNNYFSNNTYGLYFSGLNRFYSYRNSYNGGHGEALYGTGDGENYSNHNEYNTNQGIFAWQQNKYYTFAANCFNSPWYDVNAVGSINEFQGSSSVAASNCFTFGSTNDLLCVTSDTIKYYLPDPTKVTIIPVCFKPTATNSNYTIVDNSAGTQFPYCGIGLELVSSEYDYIKALGCDSTKLFVLMNNWREQIKELEKKKILFGLSYAERAKLNQYQRHLRYARNQWAWCLRKRREFRKLYEWHKSDDTKESAIKAAEALVELGDTVTAQSELDSAAIQYNIATDVIVGIKLNILYRHAQPETTVLPSNHLTLLRNVSALSDPYAAYSRALLYKLTGERVEPVVVAQVQPRSKSTAIDISETYLVSPNPASDRLNIEITDSRHGSAYRYTMVNLTGKVVSKGEINGKLTLNTTDFEPGVYIISISKDDTLVKTDKIVIIK